MASRKQIPFTKDFERIESENFFLARARYSQGDVRIRYGRNGENIRIELRVVPTYGRATTKDPLATINILAIRQEGKAYDFFQGGRREGEDLLDIRYINMADEGLLEFENAIRNSKNLPNTIKSELEAVLDGLKSYVEDQERSVNF